MSRRGNKRLVKSKSGLKIVAQHDAGTLPWELLEPSWQDDKEVLECSTTDCHTKFDFIKRRHHCRRCGVIFCSKCCGEKIQFNRMQFVDPVRHCLSCAKVTRREKVFFEEDITILITGAPFSVGVISGEKILQSHEPNDRFYECKLSSDQRFILFNSHDDEGVAIEPIALSKIKDYAIPKLENNTDPCEFTVSTSSKPSRTIIFKSPQEPSRKPSILWLSALKKALQMIWESREIDGSSNLLDSD